MYTLDKRPFSLDGIIGQESIVQDFKNRSVKGEYPEVMIFQGETGTGKTTTAFIVAGLINDPDPIQREGFFDPNPESPVCKSIRNETFNRDVYFFDGSAMGKADIQELSRLMQTAPQRDPKKVIIIDEAQELSKAGKGATLKLLEKKRRGVHIILCTMNPNAFDKAIRDRGQVYKFHPVDSTAIAQYLFSVLQDEELLESVPEEFILDGLYSIGSNCGGSVRNALQTLERALNGGIFTAEEIASEFGFIGEEAFKNLVNGVATANGKVYHDIRTVDVEEFFYKSLTVFTDLFEYYFERTITPEWRVSLLKAIEPHIEKVSTLIETVYRPMLEQTYFNKNMFLSLLGSYLYEVNKKPTLTRTPQRTPKG